MRSPVEELLAAAKFVQSSICAGHCSVHRGAQRDHHPDPQCRMLQAAIARVEEPRSLEDRVIDRALNESSPEILGVAHLRFKYAITGEEIIQRLDAIHEAATVAELQRPYRELRPISGGRSA